ncbi:MFS transporter [Cohnella suwonensis]|uniref:MFS transporter n=1 Tax=Cohnella suwonensis TaxID=696072 RepID=A0ABW0LTK5_9BACL
MPNPPQSAGRSSRLDSQTRLLLSVNGLFVTANALSGTYLGVYIWKASNDFAKVGWFSLLNHAMMALTFWIAGNGVKEGNKMAFLRAGIFVSASFYAVVLLLGSAAQQVIYGLGMLQGAAAGLFWLSFNVVYFEMTDSDNRDRYNGLAGVVGSVVGIVVPWTSGYLISRSPGANGYRLVFAISLGIFLGGFLLSFLLRHRKTDGDYDWLLPFRYVVRRDTPWPALFGALAAQGLRESVIGVLIGLLVYVETGSELRLGQFVLLSSAVGFVSFFVAGKWLKPAWRGKGMLVGAAALALSVLPLFFGVGFGTLLAYGVLSALFMPLFVVPMTSAVFDWIGSDEESASRRVEFVVLRELALNAGRIVGMAMFISTVAATRKPAIINVLLLFAGSFPLLSWYLTRGRLRVGTEDRRKRSASAPRLKSAK